MQEMKTVTQEEINKQEYGFITLVKKDHKPYGGRDFVRGKIMGYKEVICDGGFSKYAMYVTDEGTIMITKCTPDKYDHFAWLVEEHYPGLCVFNYKCDLKAIEMEARKRSIEKQKKEK